MILSSFILTVREKKRCPETRFVLDIVSFICHTIRMLKIEYVDCGSDIQVFLRGDSHEEVEQNFWSMYHHRATEKEEPTWLDEFQCYFWTQKPRLLKAFEGAALGFILNNYNEKFKGVKGGALSLAKKLAQRRFNHCERLPYRRTAVDVLNLNCYSLGTIDGRGPKVSA